MKLSKYGFRFKISKTGINVMFNGKMFSFYKSLCDGKWKFSVWSNYWRISKKVVPFKKMHYNKVHHKFTYE